VGINLLREGLDLPEVSLVAILDADKEGFLRSETSLIQTIGRAARNVEGKVIMYADTVTESMKKAIDETNRRRRIQSEYNRKYGITPKSVQKGIRDVIEVSKVAEEDAKYFIRGDKVSMSKEEIQSIINKLEKEMKSAAAQLQFERAAELRDKISEFKKKIE
jgi:excinuclease ABC subunit B